MIYWVILLVLGEVLGYRFTISWLVRMTAIIAVVFAAAAACIFGKNKYKIRINMPKCSWVWWTGIIFFLFGIVSMMWGKEKVRFCETLEYTKVQISGTVTKRIEKDTGIQYVVKTYGVNNERYHILVLVEPEYGNMEPGERVWMEGKAEPFQRATNPGGYDEQNYRYGNGIFLKLEQAEILDRKREIFSITSRLYEVQQKLIRVYRKVLDEENASLAGAMVLGDKANLDADVKELYQKNGISHLIAISGLHIAMIGGTLYHFLRKLLGSYGLAGAAGGIFIVAYGVMTGMSGATLRAIIMLLTMIGAELTGRKYDTISAVALALLIMLVENPFQILQAGFLLSFGAVLGIAWIMPVWQMYFGKFPKVLEGLGISVSVQLMTLPVMLWFFYEIPVWGFLLNLVVVPLMNVLLVCLILCGISGGIFLPAGQIFAIPADGIFKLYKWLCIGSERVPFHTFCTGRPTVAFVVLYYVFLGLFLLSQHGKWDHIMHIWCEKMKQDSMAQSKRIEWKKLALCCYVIIFIGLFVIQKLPDHMKICMLNVGQGDGIYIRTPEKMHILMDGGSSSQKQVGRYVLKNAVKYYGTHHLDYVFVSHSDSDHYSGISELMQMEEITVGNLILPAITNPDEAYQVLEQQALECNANIIYMKTGDSLQIGEVFLQCLNPEQRSYEDKNTGSLVFLLTYGNFDMLFTGDMDCQVEERILKENALGQRCVEVLKAAHHGSATASSEKFIEKISPEVSLVSVGEKNKYGHPAKEVIERLTRFSKKIYLTKDCGAVTIETDGRQYEIVEYGR